MQLKTPAASATDSVRGALRAAASVLLAGGAVAAVASAAHPPAPPRGQFD